MIPFDPMTVEAGTLLCQHKRDGTKRWWTVLVVHARFHTVARMTVIQHTPKGGVVKEVSFSPSTTKLLMDPPTVENERK